MVALLFEGKFRIFFGGQNIGSIGIFFIRIGNFFYHFALGMGPFTGVLDTLEKALLGFIDILDWCDMIEYRIVADEDHWK